MKRLFFVSLFVLILQFGALAQNREFDLGMKLAQAGDFQNALPHFQKSVDDKFSNQKLSNIYYNIGVCFYRLNQAGAAVIEFEKAVRFNPKYAKAFYALGMAQSDLKNFKEAENAFRQSLKIANNGETWFDLAVVQFELKKLEDAAISFQNAIKFGSDAIPAGHNNLGVIYALQGDFKSAENELKIAEKLNFESAADNLNIVRNAMIKNDKTLIAKLILKF